MIEKVKALVEELMAKHDVDGHGIAHINQVYDLGMKIQEKEGGDRDIIAIAILLHDVDDYKLFGEENSKNLNNAKQIMNQCEVPTTIQEAVCEIVSTMGYSKLLAGIRPKTLEGQIVSDADMCYGGATSIIRTIQYGAKIHRSVWNRNDWPRVGNLDAKEYKKYNDTAINHFFEKILKLKGLLFTETARKLAEPGHELLILFLRNFFVENNAPEWDEYLDKYLQEL